ncbi:flagellar biosynthetic protein FlhB [Enterococcus sp. AZ188]|uniref:EscU/YscU/HrcU family type III secretion system export apparatus switch protein n=1 Tax=Enterococcus sp. AZ188 TaxID=2774678 RepID=UPI003D2FB959
MAEKDGKTELPSAKRLRDARKRGEVPKTQELAAAVSLLVFSFLILSLWQFFAASFLPYFSQSLAQLADYQTSLADLPKLGVQSILLLLLLCAPVFLVALGVGLITNYAQVGLLFSGKAIKPDFKKLNPISGIKQQFSLRSLMNLGKTLAKFGVIVYLCYQQFLAAVPVLLGLSEVGLEKTILFMLLRAKELFLQISIFLMILAVVDYGYQRYSHRKNLMMSKQEVKEEFKQMEGDPQVKAQRKAKYRAMTQNAIANVKEATVLITNPTHFAIAIRYDASSEGVPRVLAKGADQLAQRMKAEALKENIPQIENREVARALYRQVEPGDLIPVEMYEAIAEIIALVYQLEESQRGKI